MYHDDCRIYIAGCCIADGLVCLPEYLSFCDKEANRMLQVSQRLSSYELKKVRDLARKEVVHTDDDMDSENPLEVLLRKHAEVSTYLSETRKKLSRTSKRFAPLLAYWTILNGPMQLIEVPTNFPLACF